MSDVAIRAERLGKLYRIGKRERYKTLRDTLTDALHNPFQRLGAVLNGRSPALDNSAEGTYIWALKELSLQVKRGEVVGIIGPNGAGKSTFLKILSRITEPTEGYVEMHGRVGSLLEVGVGFHPELTGRENVYLNGAILGMKRAEIEAKFDEIVAFAEIERFLDTPVKHYSSGMYVRLAFAVAAHLEPEILLVDEVLAVGDVAFQRKCLGKMGDVAQEGRTVLFVSHNMAAIGRLCRRGILLEHGHVATTGDIGEVISRYTEKVINSSSEVSYRLDPTKKAQILSVRLLDSKGKPSSELDREHPFSVSIQYEVRQQLDGAHVALMLDRVDGTPICHSADIDTAPTSIVQRAPGLYQTVVEFPGALLNAGAYQIRLAIARYGGETYDYREPFIFHLVDMGTFASVGPGGRQRPGLLALPLRWTTDGVEP